MGPLRARNTNVPPSVGLKVESAAASSSQPTSVSDVPATARRASSRSPAPAAPTDTDPWSHPEVRELLAENEQMFVELLAFQDLGTAYAKKRLSLFIETEARERQTIERDYWQALCAHVCQASAERHQLADKALQEVITSNEELRGFVALAQDALDPEDDVARRLSTSSPGTKRRRTEADALATPSSGGDDSGKKRSPEHLTHMRKILKTEKLPATSSLRRGNSVKN